jgi:uncharacterized protein YndB with AHSA1/START domain
MPAATNRQAEPQPKAKENRTLRLDFDFAAPPEKVWRALTEKDLLTKWLMPNDMVAKAGHKFQFRAAPPSGQWDGTVNCEVLEATPPKRLRFAWGGVKGVGPDTLVSWTLTKTASGTHLHLEQTATTDEVWATRAYGGATAGWKHFFGQQLPKLLATLK